MMSWIKFIKQIHKKIDSYQIITYGNNKFLQIGKKGIINTVVFLH